MPKYANCPSPTGQEKAVKIVLHFKIAVTYFQILIQITNTPINSIENLDIKCLSFNTRGLNKSIKRRSVFRWIHN